MSTRRLSEAGWQLFSTTIAGETLEELRDTAFVAGEAGTRCRLDLPVVRDVA